jgi:hypothetical protein
MIWNSKGGNGSRIKSGMTTGCSGTPVRGSALAVRRSRLTVERSELAVPQMTKLSRANVIWLGHNTKSISSHIKPGRT